MKNKVVLIWFRNDLRLHDNRMLHEATERNSIIIPVYCFDIRYYQKNKYNYKNTGIHRARFIRESVIALKKQLQEFNSDLLVFKGLPEEIIPKLTAKYNVDEVYHHREIAARETAISDKVETALWAQQINLKHFIGHTLYHKEDLPYSIHEIPEAFDKFKKELEKESFLREVLPVAKKILSPLHLEETQIPDLQDLGFTETEISTSSGFPIKSGEHTAHACLKSFCESDDEYIKITHLTPYIAHGVLSPLHVYKSVEQALSKKDTPHLNSLKNFLLWRDYCRFMLKKHPNIFFKDFPHHTAENKGNLSIDLWRKGETGIEIIDKAMQEVYLQGDTSYHLRKIAGKYFMEESYSPWLEGAAFFEEYLIDYEPATLYGYWKHLSGKGTCKKSSKSPGWRKLVKDYATKSKDTYIY